MGDMDAFPFLGGDFTIFSPIFFSIAVPWNFIQRMSKAASL